jgi:hypothetical protein
MIHDQNLLDRLSEMPTTGFGGEVFRATVPDARIIPIRSASGSGIVHRDEAAPSIPVN